MQNFIDNGYKAIGNKTFFCIILLMVGQTLYINRKERSDGIASDSEASDATLRVRAKPNKKRLALSKAFWQGRRDS